MTVLRLFQRRLGIREGRGPPHGRATLPVYIGLSPWRGGLARASDAGAPPARRFRIPISPYRNSIQIERDHRCSRRPWRTARRTRRTGSQPLRRAAEAPEGRVDQREHPEVLGAVALRSRARDPRLHARTHEGETGVADRLPRHGLHPFRRRTRRCRTRRARARCHTRSPGSRPDDRSSVRWGPRPTVAVRGLRWRPRSPRCRSRPSSAK